MTSTRQPVDSVGNSLSASLRGLISILLLGYMFVVAIGPFSNPVGSEFLTRPLARAVAPIHRALFLGHGYRFFGPDPGPSHLVVYRIIDEAGDMQEHRFPDRNAISPRLLYHRWFMLSESFYSEFNFAIDKASFESSDQEFAEQIQALRGKGKFGIAERIATERLRLKEQYEASKVRIKILTEGIADNLLRRHNGKQIEMFVQERSMPYPAAVLTGQKISDPRFLSDLRKIGEFRRNGKGELEAVEPLITPSRDPATAAPPAERDSTIEEKKRDTEKQGTETLSESEDETTALLGVPSNEGRANA